MAIVSRKEEKIKTVLDELPENFTDKQFVETFIKQYSRDWGKIKAQYLKQAQDKEEGTVITMPKPDLYLLSLLKTYRDRQQS
ncbi:hypothetical protein [Pedobacter antarcticus]|uniref:hypothetical protein n=1 Tax=Pedobacter antarcticus TaxID=34086 RepID=UPI000884C893|nr:hypothetical protein [Pedobacter antarcticus]SDL76220.1 hypothetical protein SAMN04488084_102372 [Pedobacter antarcticus]